MQSPMLFKKIYSAIENFQSRYKLSNFFILLVIFLSIVVLVSYIIPLLDYGRYVGTDDYTHVIYTEGMDSSKGIYDFYSQMGQGERDPENPDNFYNYPFGLWLFGSLVAKITGLTVFYGNFIVMSLFLVVIIGTFYVYCGVFLDSEEHKIIALLFMLSMPNVALILLNYRPEVFVLPFLFIILYIALQESVHWKLYPVLWLSVFIITLSHTGTFIFLISASLGFFLLYSLFWGKFSRNIYITIVSTSLIYLISLNWFPEIANQYVVKSTLFLSPGNFLADKFNFVLVRDFVTIFYQNFFVGQQLVYAILFAAALYGISRVFILIHQYVSIFISRRTFFPAVVLPIQNISHSAAASPIWLGPLQVLLSIAGFFRLDSKGKCLFITVVFTTLLPDLLHTSAGIEVATGALREIIYLVVIIPITATLGLLWILSYVNSMKSPFKSLITFIIWFIVLSAVILTPAVGTTYYLPKIAGEDYSVNGMKWLGEQGHVNEKVTGYGLRTVSIFTDMSEPSVADGSETRLFRQLLQDIHFSSYNQEKSVDDLRQTFDVKYILSSDKILANLGKTRTGLTIDSNQELDKIYSSRDFGIYEVTASTTGTSIPEYTIAQGTTISKLGSAFQVKSDYYTAVLNEKNPILERFGTKQKNYFGAGFLTENMVISGTVFDLSALQFSSEIKNNQILYRTELKVNETNYASLLVRYTFYPKVIGREYILSNDWLGGNKSSTISAKFSSLLFSPLSNYIIKNNKEQQVRKIYESQDTVVKTIKVDDIYIYNTNNQGNEEKEGIRIKNVPTSPFPLTLNYKGSTIYDLSSITTSQTTSLPSGSSLHITQFLSTGDEYGTENKIASQNGIQLDNYPDGINPIIVVGPGSSFSDSGYAILKNYSIPYAQVVSQGSNISQINDIVLPPETDTQFNTDISSETDNSSEIANPPVQSMQTVNISHLTGQGVGIIGFANMMPRNFDNITTQEKTITSLADYTKNQGASMNGFMPSSFRYNLDTIKTLNDNHISYLLSNPVNRPIQGIFDEGYRNPQMAYYNNKTTEVVMMPVSYPTSSSLYIQEDPSVTFSQWQDIINEVADNDEMIVFLFNSADIGDPTYSSQFSSLFSYAKEKGYTFTSPEIIADHYRQLQNIEYSGYADLDTASINVTNNNNKTVEKVTFKVVLDKLTSGNYITSEGKIVKTEAGNGAESVYVSTDIPGHTTQNLVIKPDTARKSLYIQLPPFMSEGPMKITVKDADGKPIKDAEVIFDTNFYQTGKDGTVTVNAHRGIYTIIIQSPGYEKYINRIEVKGQLANILQNFKLP
jgi:hypothetical protein